jgi:hypothetical protein
MLTRWARLMNAPTIALLLLAFGACSRANVTARSATESEHLWAMQTLVRQSAPIVRCLRDGSLHDRSGLLKSRFTIDPDGRVSAVEIMEDTIHSPEFRACMTEAYRAIVYPKRTWSLAMAVEHRVGAGVTELGKILPAPSP